MLFLNNKKGSSDPLAATEIGFLFKKGNDQYNSNRHKPRFKKGGTKEACCSKLIMHTGKLKLLKNETQPQLAVETQHVIQHRN